MILEPLWLIFLEVYILDEFIKYLDELIESLEYDMTASEFEDMLDGIKDKYISLNT